MRAYKCMVYFSLAVILNDWVQKEDRIWTGN